MAFKRLAVGFAFGYVVGAKAGEKRYKELRGRWEELRDHPTFQRAVERARELAQTGGQRALGAARDRLASGTTADSAEDDEALADQDEGEDSDKDDRISAEEDEDLSDDEGGEEGERSAPEDAEISDEREEDDEDRDAGVVGSLGRVAGRIRERGRVA